VLIEFNEPTNEPAAAAETANTRLNAAAQPTKTTSRSRWPDNSRDTNIRTPFLSVLPETRTYEPRLHPVFRPACLLRRRLAADGHDPPTAGGRRRPSIVDSKQAIREWERQFGKVVDHHLRTRDAPESRRELHKAVPPATPACPQWLIRERESTVALLRLFVHFLGEITFVPAPLFPDREMRRWYMDGGERCLVLSEQGRLLEPLPTFNPSCYRVIASGARTREANEYALARGYPHARVVLGTSPLRRNPRHKTQ